MEVIEYEHVIAKGRLNIQGGSTSYLNERSSGGGACAVGGGGLVPLSHPVLRGA